MADHIHSSLFHYVLPCVENRGVGKTVSLFVCTNITMRLGTTLGRWFKWMVKGYLVRLDMALAVLDTDHSGETMVSFQTPRKITWHTALLYFSIRNWWKLHCFDHDVNVQKVSDWSVIVWSAHVALDTKSLPVVSTSVTKILDHFLYTFYGCN